MNIILVVDDEASFRENVGEYLESKGYQVLQAADAETALDFGPRALYPILSAYTLRVLNGILRTAGISHIRIISTSRSPADDARAAMGADRMTIAELSQAIPPAYSEFIGRAWLAQQSAEAA